MLGFQLNLQVLGGDSPPKIVEVIRETRMEGDLKHQYITISAEGPSVYNDDLSVHYDTKNKKKEELETKRKRLKRSRVKEDIVKVLDADYCDETGDSDVEQTVEEMVEPVQRGIKRKMDTNSDSDSDYVDVNDVGEHAIAGEMSERIIGAHINAKGQKVRGKDFNWRDYEKYKNVEEFNVSEIMKHLQDNFTLRRARENEQADVEHFTCKYSRKVGFLPCPVQYKVSYMSHCDEVLVEIVEGHTDHIHDVDPEYDVKSGKTYRWTSAETAIVYRGVRNEAKPKVIMRNLRDAKVFEEGHEPPTLQLNNKIRHCRSLIQHTQINNSKQNEALLNLLINSHEKEGSENC